MQFECKNPNWFDYFLALWRLSSVRPLMKQVKEKENDRAKFRPSHNRILPCHQRRFVDRSNSILLFDDWLGCYSVLFLGLLTAHVDKREKRNKPAPCTVDYLDHILYENLYSFLRVLIIIMTSFFSANLEQKDPNRRKGKRAVLGLRIVGCWRPLR